MKIKASILKTNLQKNKVAQIPTRFPEIALPFKKEIFTLYFHLHLLILLIKTVNQFNKG